ncbi:MAG TPA: hypothetical protein VGZ02_17485 [Candidatus Baltobacteraceae bacterium]|jgi:hypothetical protein|nr:hypothetical protein [Candidatus Baltobacteraceae bacterium]
MLHLVLLAAHGSAAPSPPAELACSRKLSIYQANSDTPVPLPTQPPVDPRSIVVVVHVWVTKTDR